MMKTNYIILGYYYFLSTLLPEQNKAMKMINILQVCYRICNTL
jgi:hypothetical protein